MVKEKGWKQRALEAEEKLKQAEEHALYRIGVAQRDAEALRHRIGETRIEMCRFKTGDFVVRNLVGRVTKVEAWGVEIEAHDVNSPGSEPEYWSLEHNDPGWHIL